MAKFFLWEYVRTMQMTPCVSSLISHSKGSRFRQSVSNAPFSVRQTEPFRALRRFLGRKWQIRKWRSTPKYFSRTVPRLWDRFLRQRPGHGFSGAVPSSVDTLCGYSGEPETVRTTVEDWQTRLSRFSIPAGICSRPAQQADHPPGLVPDNLSDTGPRSAKTAAGYIWPAAIMHARFFQDDMNCCHW